MVYNLTIKYQAPDHRSQQSQYQLMIVLVMQKYNDWPK